MDRKIHKIDGRKIRGEVRIEAREFATLCGGGMSVTGIDEHVTCEKCRGLLRIAEASPVERGIGQRIIARFGYSFPKSFAFAATGSSVGRSILARKIRDERAEYRAQMRGQS